MSITTLPPRILIQEHVREDDVQADPLQRQKRSPMEVNCPLPVALIREEIVGA